MKIKEGEIFRFLVGKTVKTTENDCHIILTGPNRTKYLLPLSRYSNYGIKEGKYIKCRIDKINCKGEVFLEPAHPFYKEGKSYLFDVVGESERENTTGEKVKVLIVKDKFGNQIPVQNPLRNRISPHKIRLTVERISKGKLNLVTSSSSRKKSKLLTGENYNFLVERYGTGIDDREYFIVKDTFGDFHTVDRSYYNHYGLEPGKWFKGKIVSHRKNGEIIIEPENPFYKPGDELKLKITGVSKNPVNDNYAVELKDEFGFNHCIDLSEVPETQYIICRVERIKKGMPSLVSAGNT